MEGYGSINGTEHEHEIGEPEHFDEREERDADFEEDLDFEDENTK